MIRIMEDIRVDDRVILKKLHPCGGREWVVVRIGADIGLECLTCGHKIFLSRRELSRRMKSGPVRNSDEGLPEK
ncbi:MAG: DUF951 domain-containing protein [Anaerolineaceae bacterium]|nr:DUF951 domain-containing protein [Anaerolineaceae bacterium]